MSASFLTSALIQFALGLVVAWVLGAAEFGAYAIALAAAVLIQNLAFEWIRLSATRFHHPEDGGRLATLLLRVFIRIAAVMLIAALMLAVFGGTRRWLLCLVPLIASVAGFVDFRAALLRAEFDQRGYALLMVLRNALAIVLLPLAAYGFGSAEAVLAAFLLALLVAGGMIEFVLRRRGKLEPVNDDGSRAPDIVTLVRYAGPIVLTNCLYLALFFGLRSAIAVTGGLAAAGQFSLALDFVLKLFTTVGTALDLMLFQLAVRDAREKGSAVGRLRVRSNAEIILAVILPMAIGLFFVIHPLEWFLVAPEFRGVFAMSVAGLLPGIALYALVQYALHPYLQLEHHTSRLAHAAFAGLIVAGLILASSMTVLPLLPVFTPIGLAATAVAVAMGTSALVLMWAIGRASVPAGGFLARLALALGGMVGAVLLIQPMGQGGGVLALMIITGCAAYGAAAYMLDLAGIRQILRMRSAG